MSKKVLFNRSAFSQAKGHGIKRKTKQGLITGLVLAAAFTITGTGQNVFADDSSTAGAAETAAAADDTVSETDTETLTADTVSQDKLTAETDTTDTDDFQENSLSASASEIAERSETVTEGNSDTEFRNTNAEIRDAQMETAAEDSEVNLSEAEASSDENTATISISAEGVSANSDSVTVSENNITITQAGSYSITGAGDGYSITVDSSVTEAVTLNFDNLELTNSSVYTSGDLYIFILSDSSVSSALANTIEAEGALYVTSKDKSSLTVSSSAKHALKAASVTIDGAVLNLVSASKDGIHATTDVKFINSTVFITAGDDGIQIEDDTDVNSADLTITDSTVTINAADKGITAGDEVTVEGNSEVTITAGDEGIEGRSINLTGGTITINAGDDGINATEWTSKDSADLSQLVNSADDIENEIAITIAGATVYVTAAADALDSNGNLTISSGNVYLAQTSMDNSALDYDGTGTITGGTVWAIGSSGMAQAFMTGSSQAYIMVNVSGSQGDMITITDSDGNVTASTTAETDFSNVIFSSEHVNSGAAYTVTVSSGASAAAAATTETTANGFGMGAPGIMGDNTVPAGNPPSFDEGITAADGFLIFPDFSQIDGSEETTAVPSDTAAPLLPKETDISGRNSSSAGDSTEAPLPSEQAAFDSDADSETIAPSASSSQSQTEEEDDSEKNTAEQTDKAETQKNTEAANDSDADLNLETKAKQIKEQTEAKTNFLEAKHTNQPETAPAPYSNTGNVYKANSEDLQPSGKFSAFTAGNYREYLSANSVPYPAFAYSDLSSNRYSRTNKQHGPFRAAAQTQPAVSQKLAVRFKTKTWNKSGQYI